MSLENRDSSPFQPDEEFPLGLTVPVSRRDLLADDAFSNMDVVPRFTSGALQGLARDRSVQGFAVVEYQDEVGIRILREYPGEKGTQRIAGDFAYLQFRMDGIYPEYTDMKGKTFEEMETEIRREVLQQEGAQLMGILRFTE